MKPLLRSTALGMLLLGVQTTACLDVDGVVDQFCLDNPRICKDGDGGSDAGPDGNDIQDAGGPDGGDAGQDGEDAGQDAGPDGGIPDDEREPPGWKSVDPMRVRRTGHTATALGDGRVLVVGGSSTGDLSAVSPTNTTELYTLASNSWSPGRNLGTARMNHTATLLLNGKVLVVGGRGPTGGALDSAEIYDVGANQWTAVSPIPGGARATHAAVLLPSGKVLVTGGGFSGDDGLNTSELYDPASNSWTKAGDLNVNRNMLTLTLLDGGVALAIGGFHRNGAETTAEVYDSNSPDGGWRLLSQRMGRGRNGHASTLLPSGQVLVTGSLEGSPGTVLPSVDLFEPGSASWTSQANMGEARFLHTATALPSGEVLVTGGYATPYAKPRASAEILRRDGGWEPIAPMSSARTAHTATWLESGSVLIIGGTDGGVALNTAERYVP
ncbi:kelch domain-containing protein [Corallococcus coralloides DSM 2259]|uniref:Kelch domain-containing protein n=1 Tax=Corallococcus coralloides (strain ATCC 25202 / DSM 2259 / NBRC 100086 / M2) TaxID=1144275 RepID=H8MJN3_CORCM|nr:kelch repeat-containing protein [Corallococcus coralloides]AFE06681.1 kelch domain-containing protein [Corallococcus coralloides DSM 2259]